MWLSRLRDYLFGRAPVPHRPAVAPPADIAAPSAGGAPPCEPILREADMVDGGGCIVVEHVLAIAAYRAGLEYDRFLAAGMTAPPLVQLFSDEVAHLNKIVDAIMECRRLEAELAGLPPEQRAARTAELKNYI